MIPSVLQNLGFSAGVVSTPTPTPTPTGGGSSGGRYINQRTGRAIHWAPDTVGSPSRAFQYKKTKQDYELEELLKAAIKREDLEREAKKIAQKASERVTSVQDVSRAARAVEREVLSMRRSDALSNIQKKLQKIKEEEDLIIALLLSDI